MADSKKEAPVGTHLENGPDNDPIFNSAQLEALSKAGFETPEQAVLATDAELLAIPSIGDSTLKRWRDYTDAQGYVRPEVSGDTLTVEKGPPISTPTDTGVDPIPAAREPLPAQLGDAPGKCPTCGNRVMPYLGENPHKQGTAWCPKCGVRVSAQKEPAEA